MAGRFHAYEGHTAAQIAFPVRVLCELGVQTLIISNACGSMAAKYRRTCGLALAIRLPGALFSTTLCSTVMPWAEYKVGRLKVG